jgi:3D (Asp-Asp-Asp) domain-containing protein
MHKRNRIATALLLSSSLFLLGGNSAGQGKQLMEVQPVTTEIPQKSLSLTPKELPKGKTIREAEKGQQEANTEVTGVPQPKSKTVDKPYTELTVEATAYVSFCDTGCIGITKGGSDVKTDIYHDETGLPIVAVDPNLIPLGAIVEIDGTKYIADDTGGDIKGHRIDILVATTNTDIAFDYGRQTVDIKVFK